MTRQIARLRPNHRQTRIYLIKDKWSKYPPAEPGDTYYLFPNYALMVLGNKEYLQAAPILGLFAIFMSLLSLNYLLANFLFSVNKKNILGFIALGALGQIIGITFYHQTLATIITVSIVCTGVLFTMLLVYVFNAQFITVCRRSKWSKHVTNSSLLASSGNGGV